MKDIFLHFNATFQLLYYDSTYRVFHFLCWKKIHIVEFKVEKIMEKNRILSGVLIIEKTMK